MDNASHSYLTQHMRLSPLSFSPQQRGGKYMVKTQQEFTPVKQKCNGCSFHGRMKIKRGKRVIIYCPKCGTVMHRRYVY